MLSLTPKTVGAAEVASVPSLREPTTTRAGVQAWLSWIPTQVTSPA